MIDLRSLNPQQRRAVETVEGPVLILAGAGTGKTRVITFRIAHMLDLGIRPGNILAVTFTNKAAREMKERIRSLAPGSLRKDKDSPGNELTISTFHSLCVRILRRYIDRLGYKRNFVIYSQSDQVSVVRKLLSRISMAGEKVDPGDLLSLISRLKNTSGRADALGQDSMSKLAEHLITNYDQALHACNAVDFDDLILLVLKLFSKHAEVLEACRQKYRYVMVDEYQDTNAAQFQLIRYLTSEHQNLCVVGDDDQSIYGWRGAEIGNLLNLEKYYPKVKVIKLEQNYRSTNCILNAANAVIKNNSQRRPKQLWSDKGQGSKIELLTFNDEEEEARSVVENIEFARMARRIPWSDQAILFRTNAQSRPMEAALRKAGVRYHLVGGQSFFDRREIKDLLSYLKMMINPHDDNSLLRIANVPARGLSDETMERLLGESHERKCSVFTLLSKPPADLILTTRTRGAMTDFAQWIERARHQLHDSATRSLSQWTEKFLAEIGYIEDLRRSEKNSESVENRIRNLRDLIATMDGDPYPPGKAAESLETFIEDLTLDGERAEEKKTSADAVTLITLHSCKGLEFPHVHIVGVEEGMLPHSQSKVEGKLDEERRLFYVAITRAMKTLAISHCQGRKKYGQLVPCHPSQFLSELPEDLVEWVDPQAKKPVAPDTGKSLFSAMRDMIE